MMASLISQTGCKVFSRKITKSQTKMKQEKKFLAGLWKTLQN